MKYALEDLLRVRKFREDAAATEVTESRKRLEDSESQLVERRKELQEYVQWRLTREEELYQEIMEQHVHLNALEEVKTNVQILRDKDQTYQEKVITAEKGVEDAKQQLEEALRAHREAARNREKLDEHKAMWLEEAQKEVEAAAETEMEDFRVKANALEA